MKKTISNLLSSPRVSRRSSSDGESLGISQCRHPCGEPVPPLPALERPGRAHPHLILDEGGRVKAGSPERLIDHLTSPEQFDHRFCLTLLLTYRSFYTPVQLLQALVCRYHALPPSGLSDVELGHWETEEQHPVQLIVCNVLQKWLRDYISVDEFEDGAFVDELSVFIDCQMCCSPRERKLGELLQAAVSRRTEGRKRGKAHFSSDPPQCLFRDCAFGQEARVCLVPPVEWARQLTLIDFELFQKIGASELLGQAWAKADKEQRARNVLTMIHHFNNISAWVAGTVLSWSYVASRAEAFGHMIDVCAECLKLGNFNGAFAINAGLENAAVHRLKRTKELLPAAKVAALEQAGALLSSASNHKAYRAALEKREPPCIPFLGTFDHDATELFPASATH
mmetsp:Transcript_53804/g.123789  ORF Transcript_53804/g.123789 Transcript_53804/m.123789 type:complete len:396 (-) Transcript_53804:119-1306(-)